jgi:hypothetical protein
MGEIPMPPSAASRQRRGRAPSGGLRHLGLQHDWNRSRDSDGGLLDGTRELLIVPHVCASHPVRREALLEPRSHRAPLYLC